jgi:hypothetical protein
LFQDQCQCHKTCVYKGRHTCSPWTSDQASVCATGEDLKGRSRRVARPGGAVAGGPRPPPRPGRDKAVAQGCAGFKWCAVNICRIHYSDCGVPRTRASGGSFCSFCSLSVRCGCRTAIASSANHRSPRQSLIYIYTNIYTNTLNIPRHFRRYHPPLVLAFAS